uniref:Uncharacterized protein n=1 Tax=Ixodes ricinus TaxID=34613 RepID=A0A6B0UN30_IXORI
MPFFNHPQYYFYLSLIQYYYFSCILGKNKIKFNFPWYVPNHHAFASNLVRLCEEHTRKPQERNAYKPRINDLQVNFKNCTFLCKREFYNVTLDLPQETPCGPNNQTCKNKEECVPYIPGC